MYNTKQGVCPCCKEPISDHSGDDAFACLDLLAHTKSPWVSVDDDLPQDGQIVLASYVNTLAIYPGDYQPETRVALAYYMQGEPQPWWHLGPSAEYRVFDRVYQVIKKWMPIPDGWQA